MNDKSALRYLSLAAKAGRLVTGGDEVEKQMRRGKRGTLLLASDAGSDALRRAGNLAHERSIPLWNIPYTKSELAAAVGRARPVALALITDKGLAAAFAAAAAIASEQEEHE